MPSRKIIIDTDPGQDDAIGILLALASPKELDVLGRRLKDAIFYYREHIRDWVKHSYVSEPIDESRLGLDQTKLIEHNEYLEKTQGVPADEDVVVGGN